MPLVAPVIKTQQLVMETLLSSLKMVTI